MAISVCMATYNGAEYVERQIRSILDQLGGGDELVIVDDGSRDATAQVIGAIADPRIRLERNARNRREIYSFGRAIELARNEFIFCSDQDDIWVPDRARLMVRRLEESGAALVTSNFTWIDENERPIHVPFDGVRVAQSKEHWANIRDIFAGRTNYFGCAMAFRRSLVPLIVPIPAYVESHDLWIALAANLIGSNLHIEDTTLLKRRHSSNTTSTVSSRPLSAKLYSRLVFARSLVDLNRRRSAA